MIQKYCKSGLKLAVYLFIKKFHLLLQSHLISLDCKARAKEKKFITSLMYYIFERRKVFLRAKDGCLG